MATFQKFVINHMSHNTIYNRYSVGKTADFVRKMGSYKFFTMPVEFIAFKILHFFLFSKLFEPHSYFDLISIFLRTSVFSKVCNSIRMQGILGRLRLQCCLPLTFHCQGEVP